MVVLERPTNPPGGGSLLQERCKYIRLVKKSNKEGKTKNTGQGEKKTKKKWSKKHDNLKFGAWNPWSYCNERHEYCKTLGYSLLGLGELHNKQGEKRYQGRLWQGSELSEKDEDGNYKDKAAGVAIMISPRIVDKVIDKSSEGTRIAWV